MVDELKVAIGSNVLIRDGYDENKLICESEIVSIVEEHTGTNIYRITLANAWTILAPSSD